MLRTAFFVVSGNSLASVLTLARNLLIARFVSVEDFGIAATFAVAIALVEMASALGLQQRIVQDPNGDVPAFQAALQGFHLLRSLLSATVLFVLARPIADFMNVPQAAWGYQAMALVPVLYGLTHFDVYRLSRSMDFRAMIVVSTAPALISLATAWPFVAWLGDWRAMLAVILLHAILSLIGSHLMSQRPYRLSIDWPEIRRSLIFGWPILIQGGLLFLIFNGDRLIVGRELGMGALGIFSIGVTLTLTPVLVLEKSVQSLFLPLLSRIDRATPGGPAEFREVARLATETVLAAAVAFLVGVALLGGTVVGLILDDRYDALIPFLVLLGGIQVAHLVQASPSVMALSIGRTSLAMTANLVRVAMLPVAWLTVTRTGELSTLLWVAMAGEIGGYVVASLLIQRSVPGWFRVMALPHLGLVAVFVCTLVVGQRNAAAGSDPGWADAALILLFAALALWSLPTLRRHLLDLGRRASAGW